MRQHAHARSVQVSFSVSDGTARVAIADDGCGFRNKDSLCSSRGFA